MAEGSPREEPAAYGRTGYNADAHQFGPPVPRYSTLTELPSPFPLPNDRDESERRIWYRVQSVNGHDMVGTVHCFEAVLEERRWAFGSLSYISFHVT